MFATLICRVEVAIISWLGPITKSRSHGCSMLDWFQSLLCKIESHQVVYLKTLYEETKACAFYWLDKIRANNIKSTLFGSYFHYSSIRQDGGLRYVFAYKEQHVHCWTLEFSCDNRSSHFSYSLTSLIYLHPLAYHPSSAVYKNGTL